MHVHRFCTKKTVKGRNKEVTINSHNCGFELYNILKFHVQIIRLDISNIQCLRVSNDFIG